MAGEPADKVLAVFCSMLWKERPQLLAVQGGEPEAPDLAGAGGNLQVWKKREYTRLILKQGG